MGSRHTVRKFMHHSHGMGRTETHTLNHKFSVNVFFLENRFDIFSRPISNLPRWVIGWETVTRQWDADATDLQVFHRGDHTCHLSKEASWSTWTIDLQQNLCIWFLTAIGVVFNNSTIIGLKGTAECQPKGFEKPRAYKWFSFKEWRRCLSCSLCYESCLSIFPSTSSYLLHINIWRRTTTTHTAPIAGHRWLCFEIFEVAHGFLLWCYLCLHGGNQLRLPEPCG